MAPQTKPPASSQGKLVAFLVNRLSDLVEPPPTRLHKLKKQSHPKGRTAKFLLSFKLYKVTYKIDNNTDGDGKNHNLYNKMYGNIIINAVT